MKNWKCLRSCMHVCGYDLHNVCCAWTAALSAWILCWLAMTLMFDAGCMLAKGQH